jgi:Domain of unknown function (DUF4340)
VKAKAALVHAGLAVGGLAFAYVTWQRPKETRNDDQVVVVEAAKKSIDKIRYEDGLRWIELVRKVDGEAVVSITQGMFEDKVKAQTPDAGVVLDAGFITLPDGGLVAKPLPPPPRPPVIVPTRTMKGSDRAEKVFDKFAPLQASRALGKLGEEKRKELGLTGSERRLTVTVAGQVHGFIVSTPQAGLVGQYLEDLDDQGAYLLAGTLIGELDPGSQALIDRKLHTFRPADFDEFEVKYEDAQRSYLQTGAEIAQTAKVAPKDKPDQPDELVKNWHDKVFNRFIVTEVLGAGELPRGGEPKVVLQLRYLARGKEKGFLTLAKGEGTEYWAKSENTLGWVGVHAGVDEVLLEARRVATGQ